MVSYKSNMIINQNPRLFGYVCKLAYLLGNLQMKFNPVTKQVTLDSNRSTKYLTSGRYYLSTCLVTIIGIQCALKEKGSLMEKIITWNSLLFLLIGHVYIREFKAKSNEILLLIRNLFQIYHILPSMKENHKAPLLIKINVAFVYAGMLTVLILPIGFVHGLHWENPCKPALAGYWLIPRCHSVTGSTGSLTSFDDFLIQPFVLVMNHWLWSFSCHAAICAVCMVLIFVVISILQLVERLKTVQLF